MTFATATDWEEFASSWNAVFAAPNALADVSEGSVAGQFAGRLLQNLGWRPENVFFEVTVNIQLGSKSKDFRMDIVLAASLADARTPGKTFAVLELKRPSVNDLEAARRQAQCYADHLRAPIYAVVDGHTINVWRRRLVQEDEPALSITRAEVQTRFDDLRSHLGSTQLHALREQMLLSDEAVSQAYQRLENIDLRTPCTRLSIRNGTVHASCDRATFLRVEQWWGRPSTQPTRVDLSLAGSYADWEEHGLAIVYAICRVAVHAAHVQLHVDDPERWNREIGRVDLLLERHHGFGGAVPASNRGDPVARTYELGDQALLAQELHGRLDQWVVEAVKYQIAKTRMGSGELEHWNRADVRSRLNFEWTVSAAWLASALEMNAGDTTHGGRRLGFHAISYLTDAVLFPMAVSNVICSLRLSTNPKFSNNLEYLTADGTAGQIGFAYAMSGDGQIDSSAYLLFLSCSNVSPELIRPHKHIGAAPQSFRSHLHIGERATRGIIFRLTDDARRILTFEGWAQFESYIASEVEKQITYAQESA